MKILHANDHYERRGGAETVLFNTLEALEEKGIVNVVVHQHPTSVRINHRPSYQIAHLGDASQRNGLAADRFRTILDKEHPDVVHLHDIGNPDIARISLGAKPTVQSVFNHSFYCPGGSKYLPLLKRVCHRPFGAGCVVSAFATHCNSVRPGVLWSSYRRSHRMLTQPNNLRFTVLSDYQMKTLIQNGIASERISKLPPFVSLPSASEVGSLKVDDKMLLFVGRVVPQKGLFFLLRSLALVRIPFRLVVNGEGPDLARTKKLTMELNLQDRVEFIGWAPKEMHLQCYRQTSFLVMPSIWPEPLGMVGLEAMSYAKPVIAFEVGGIPDWLENQVTGYLVKPQDVREMARRINNYLEDPELAHEMGSNGRKKVEALFTKEKYVSSLINLYSEAIHAWHS